MTTNHSQVKAVKPSFEVGAQQSLTRKKKGAAWDAVPNSAAALVDEDKLLSDADKQSKPKCTCCVGCVWLMVGDVCVQQPRMAVHRHVRHVPTAHVGVLRRRPRDVRLSRPGLHVS
jgi:hypothetical protein